MTYSDCWIDTIDDEEFKAFTAERRSIGVPRREKIHILPPAPKPRWITTVKDWAAAQGLPVNHNDPLEIQVPVSRDQLLAFLAEMFPPGPTSPAEPLRAHAMNRFKNDCTYLIVADEF